MVEASSRYNVAIAYNMHVVPSGLNKETLLGEHKSRTDLHALLRRMEIAEMEGISFSYKSPEPWNRVAAASVNVCVDSHAVYSRADYGVINSGTGSAFWGWWLAGRKRR